MAYYFTRISNRFLAAVVTISFLTSLLVNALITNRHIYQLNAFKFSITPHGKRMEPTALKAAMPALAQYAPAATSLFNNMKTPASILAGAMVPLGFLSPLPALDDKEESKYHIIMRRLYLLITLFSFCSELLAVMWATVAVNQLTERAIQPAESVWHLLKRDCDLQWSAVNSHFVSGMLGFMWLIGTRAFFMVQAAKHPTYMTISTASLIAGALMLMVSVVNRAVAAGGGTEGSSYGGTILALFGRYIYLMGKQATNLKNFGFLECGALIGLTLSVGVAVLGIFKELNSADKSKKP
mmetsp:Transcript_1010/g.1976  ORF Transcript_1010/g.1976 Transcript_1010/m.1976 type:complete len:296 (-) Transcript_1010:50-937(-)